MKQQVTIENGVKEITEVLNSNFTKYFSTPKYRQRDLKEEERTLRKL